MPSDSNQTPALPGLEPAPALRVAFLGSGSSGNATAIAFGPTLVLLDCGFSARETRRRLDAVGMGATPISAILVTHEHGDHVAGLRVLTKRSETPVHASGGTWRGVRAEDRPLGATVVRPGDGLRVGRVEVRAFGGSHDTSDPLGYTFSAGGRKVGVCTDCGRVTPEILEALEGCDLLGIETNHDAEMLERGPYPAFLKRRILSHRGHLSNSQAAQALERLASDRLRTLVGLHLSRTNNTPELALAALGSRARSLGLGAEIRVASQFEPLVCELPAEEAS